MSFEDLSNAAAAEKKTIPTESPIEKRITERLEKGASAERQIELNQELARVLDFFLTWLIFNRISPVARAST